ncbi:MAG: MgtC/SapB family protein [Lachnospiraceae bacterium]
MFLEQISMLSQFNAVSVTLRLFMALIIGAALGLEREQKQRPAGLRTYTLVCVGSALAAVTSLYMAELYGSTVDPSRIPAQIISGIGFLGAGTIMVTRIYRVKGLTTAAGLWCCAAIGIAVGVGFYSGALLSGIMIVVSLRLFSFVDKRFIKFNKYIYCYAEYKSKSFIKELVCYTRKNDYQIFDLEISKDAGDGGYFATFQIKIRNPEKREEVLSEMQELQECIVLEEIQ